LARCVCREGFAEEFFQQWKGDEIKERDEDDGADGPGLDAVEGGHAEITGELGGAFLELAHHLRDGEFDKFDTVQLLAEADEDENEGKMERVGEGFEEMEDGLIEFKNPTGDEADEGCGAHDREDAEGDTEGNGPGELLGGDAAFELVDDGLDDPAAEAGGFIRFFGFVCHRECRLVCGNQDLGFAAA